MQRFTISLEDALARAFDGLIAMRGYANRSKAVCDLLRGPALAVRAFGDAVCAERGVHHGKLNLISVEAHQRHRHGGHDEPHHHLRPAT